MRRQGIHFPHLCPAFGGWRLSSGLHLAFTCRLCNPRVGPWLNPQDSQNWGATFSLGLILDILSFQEFAIEKLISI